MPDYGDDRGFGLDRVNPFEQTAQAGSMPGYQDRPSDREIDKFGAAYNETIAGDRAKTGIPAPFWAQKNWPSYPPENPYGVGLDRFETSYVPQNRKFRQDPMSKILNTLDDFYGGVKGGAKATWDEFFGGAGAAEINPQKVLESDWAQTPIDWEDIEPGWNLGAETDAWEALQNKDLGINTWGDMYYALNNPNVNNWALSQSPMSSSILEEGLGSYMDEGYFPQIQESWSLGNVDPTVENWRNRAWFDLDEGSFQNEGDYDRLIKEGWLKDPNKPFAFQDLYQNRPSLPKDIIDDRYFE